ncbi:very short patch repair endonuclease [Hyphomonas sp.]|uniref:very short patch repair endonuclease n=1 Tax=Hyphomonas sp. TaxID=87 RepID=UPI003D2D7173
MSAVRGRDTRPELIVRKGLHRLGLRYRLNVKQLPGKPDLVFPKFEAALFVHGCFWHGHDCPLFKLPATRTEFWKSKIAGNVRRDIRSVASLRELGWRTGIIWECAVRGPGRPDPDMAMRAIRDWIRNDGPSFELAGTTSGTGVSPLVAP